MIEIERKFLIVSDNYTTKNGGGLAFAGSDATVINCTIKNNTAVTDGGGFTTTEECCWCRNWFC